MKRISKKKSELYCNLVESGKSVGPDDILVKKGKYLMQWQGIYQPRSSTKCWKARRCQKIKKKEHVVFNFLNKTDVRN